MMALSSLAHAEPPTPSPSPSVSAAPSAAPPQPSPAPAPSPAPQAIKTPAPMTTPTPRPRPLPVKAPAPTPTPVNRPYAAIDFDRVDDDRIVVFKTLNGSSAPKPLKTGLYDLKYLGPLRASDDEPMVPPYFLFSGRPCKDCLQDTAIYAIRSIGGRPVAYVYPGKIFEHRSRALVMESRAFYGRCLRRLEGSAYVVFQKEHVDRRRGMQSSVLIAQPGDDHMDERLIERHLPRLQDTLHLVKLKVCHEIEGRNRIALARPLDVKARNTGDDSDDDDDSGPKENQTDGDLTPPSGG